MSKRADNRLLIFMRSEESPGSRRIWGTGGWLPPEEREALDWFTLARLLGWGATLSEPDDEEELLTGTRWIIVACDPELLGQRTISLLAAQLQAQPTLVVARASRAGTEWASLAGAVRRENSLIGQSLRWTGSGPERNWHCRKALGATPLSLEKGTRIWGTLDGAPIVAARQVGQGVVATLSFHPSLARDTDGAATSFLRHLLLWGADWPVAWLDWSGTLVLRMDDPGGAQNIHSRDWCYRKLNEAQWAAVGRDLQSRDARLSLGYISGWVDDGDAARGMLLVDGQVPPRIPGAVYPSPLVQYLDRAGHAPGTENDYEAEYRGIQALRAAGLADVELHGHTHMHPDTAEWASAPDRHANWPASSWFREFDEAARGAIAARPADQHPLALGIAAFRRFFHTFPTTLICPGDLWTPDIPERALELGLQLLGSYYLALRDGTRLCWCQHVCAPYLNQPDAAWFDAELPVIGYFHDYELATEGVQWMSGWLDRWQENGARRLVDYRELAAALCRRVLVVGQGDHKQLIVTSHLEAPPLVRPLAVRIREPNGSAPQEFLVSMGGMETPLPVNLSPDGSGTILVPASFPDSS